MHLPSLALIGTLATLSTSAYAQYTPAAASSAPMDRVSRTWTADDGKTYSKTELVKPQADQWGNAEGNQHDLAVDGAFEGQTVAVMQLYVDPSFDFSLPKAALAEKGFATYRWINAVPAPADLEAALAKSSQLWVISGSANLLTPEHVAIIKRFFDAGHGVYIWGDNDPYYADANVLAQALLGTQMHGDTMGDHTVGLLADPHAGGIKPNHLLSTGLENIYEGITIATIDVQNGLEPLIYGSAGNLVAAYYDHDGKRAILDGGFTRLYMKWDTAGTARYVKNAASWLVNAERFGDAVINPAVKKTVGTTIAADREPPEPAPLCGGVQHTTADDPFLSRRTGLVLLALLAGMIVLVFLPRRVR
jgi:hypothetical protein